MSEDNETRIMDKTEPRWSHVALQELISPRYRADRIPLRRFFLARYTNFPCGMTCISGEKDALLHVPTILKYLADQFGHDTKNDVVIHDYNDKIKEYFVNYRLCDLGNGIMIFFNNILLKSDVMNHNRYASDYSDDYFLVCPQVKICYNIHLDSMVKELGNLISKMSMLKISKSQLSFIYRSRNGGYQLSNIHVKDPLIHDLALHYGKSFTSVHQKIFNGLSKKDAKGLVLLHGQPGTGKTHYIRYLIEHIKDKTLIYVPPDLAKDLSKPAFLSFLLQNPNSILIIEDAENIVRDRLSNTFNPNQAVANLLNLSDGLLNDALSMQILATFNCPLSNLDPALLRPGRLIAIHEFNRLDVPTARLLSEKLGFSTDHITTPMTLADIYNPSDSDNTDAQIIK